MEKEGNLPIDPSIFKCVVGQVSFEFASLLADSRPVCIAARNHLNGDPIPTRIAKRAALALDLEIIDIISTDPRLVTTDPNSLTITAQTRFGPRTYHFTPLLT